MTRFRKNCSEIRICGRIAVSGSGALLGRVRFFDESYTEGSILCVRGGEAIDRETLLLCPPIAVIVFCYESAESLGVLCSLGVPCLVFDEFCAWYECCKNKVALIDAERGILTIDPSIDTLGFYSTVKNKSLSFNIGCSVGKILKNSEINFGDANKSESYLIRVDRSINDIFEWSVELWERFSPEFLLFDIPIPKGSEGEERFFSNFTEELYRAALYGSFAISLSGFDCEGEFSRAMQILHKTFCILEAEGREFNAYLPRGIMISAPLWLMRASPVTNPDFLIFDLDTLLPSLFSLSCEEIIKKEKALKKELLTVFERYFSSFAPRCDVYLKTALFADTRLLQDIVCFTNAKIAFLS